MKKISVIIPTYNRADKIEKSIRSVLNQTYSDMEVLVVDDASTDNTRDVVCSIQDERVRYIRLEQNGGASAARNAGVSFADTEWIAFHDSDDAWRFDKLEKQIQYRDLHPEYDLIYTAYVLHLANEEDIYVPGSMPVECLQGDMYNLLLKGNTIGAPTILMRKAVFEEVNGFDTTWKSLEDWDFVLRISKNHKIGYVNEILLDAYRLEGSISSNVGAYYSSRCRMIAEHKEEMVKRGLFDEVLLSLFQKAQQEGVLEMVQKLLMQSLMQYQ